MIRTIHRDYRRGAPAGRTGQQQLGGGWHHDGDAAGRFWRTIRTGRCSFLRLRKTVHLVGPGWNAIGAGEPALPAIALGHNENIAFGFTIVGIDQQDLYVEKLNPQNPLEYQYRGAWKKFDVERQTVKVKGDGRADG